MSNYYNLLTNGLVVFQAFTVHVHNIFGTFLVCTGYSMTIM